jgi:hypothetical protein
LRQGFEHSMHPFGSQGGRRLQRYRPMPGV